MIERTAKSLKIICNESADDEEFAILEFGVITFGI
jgi:hypothetical protein